MDTSRPASDTGDRPVVTITLTGGRGSVTGTVGHANPNYTLLLDEDGTERYVPAPLIADIQRTREDHQR